MFRFTIRDVLWLTVVVGLAVALWMQHRATYQERRSKALAAEQIVNLRQTLELEQEENRRQVVIGEVFMFAIHNSGLSQEQKSAIGKLIIQEAARRGHPIRDVQ